MKAIFLNPFQNYSEKILIGFGLIMALIGCGLATNLNARFDGVLDLHFVEKTNFLNVIIDIAIDILILSLFIFLVGKYINRKTRFIDVLATTLIAKIPFYFLIFFNINNKMFLISKSILSAVTTNEFSNIQSNDLLLLVFSGIATFVCLVWSIILLFNGFKTATNSKGSKNVLLFIIAIIAAEVLSKILIIYFN